VCQFTHPPAAGPHRTVGQGLHAYRGTDASARLLRQRHEHTSRLHSEQAYINNDRVQAVQWDWCDQCCCCNSHRVGPPNSARASLNRSRTLLHSVKCSCATAPSNRRARARCDVPKLSVCLRQQAPSRLSSCCIRRYQTPVAQAAGCLRGNPTCKDCTVMWLNSRRDAVVSTGYQIEQHMMQSRCPLD
jgi:hypothetical protein